MTFWILAVAAVLAMIAVLWIQFVTMSQHQTFCVLRVLYEAAEPLYGLEIVKRSQGEVLSGSSVYVVLKHLTNAGLASYEVEPHETVPGIKRHMYRITKAGRERFDGPTSVA